MCTSTALTKVLTADMNEEFLQQCAQMIDTQNMFPGNLVIVLLISVCI